VDELSIAAVLNAPVRLRGIRLGVAVDVLLDRTDWHPVGFEVHCGDYAPRFLPFSTVSLGEREVAIESALMLLEEIEFYRARSLSARALLGSTIELGDERGGELRDLLISADGVVRELVLGSGGDEQRVPAAGTAYTVAARDAA
jgi:hypothetical protein